MMKESIFNRARLTPHLAFYTGIFVIFLATGVWSGRLIGSSGSLLTPSSLLPDSNKSVQAPITVPTTDQHNLLVIGVDKLNTKLPKLESAWLIMFFPGKPDFTFLPIYPMPGEHRTRVSSNLPASFSLDTAGRPNPEFLHQLAGWIWWNNYLVIDQAGMITLIDMLGGISQNNRNLDGAQAMARMVVASQDSTAAYASQVSLLAGICSQTKNHLSENTMASALRRMEPNLTTDLDLSDSMDIWLDLNKKSLAVRCEFPITTPSIP